MTENKHRRTVFSMLVIAVCAITLPACGGADTSNEVTHTFAKSSVARCLQKAGATFAQSTGELSFLSDAEVNDKVSKVGISFDRADKVVVNLWSKHTLERGMPDWLMWIGQPFDQQRSPSEIVDMQVAGSYVAYIVGPSRLERRKLNSCIDFFTGRTDPPSVILRSDDFKRESGN